MIDENKPFGNFDVYCDECDYDENFDTNGDFYQLIREIKQNGWIIKKVNGEFRHYCPDCKEQNLCN